MLPFRDRYHIDRIHEGGIYYTYLYQEYPELIPKLGSKLFWVNIFRENDINHPKLYVSKLHNKIEHYANVSSQKEYILKPIFGGLGYGVTVIKGYEIPEYLQKYNDIIIQEKMNDCVFENSTVYRLNTLYNGEIFSFSRQSNNIITTQGGPFIDCSIENCFPNAVVREKFIVMLDKLRNLHRYKYKHLISIGWDLILHCKGTKIDFYCLEGNIFGSTYRYKNKAFKKYIDKFQKVVREFYALNGI